MTEVGQFKIGNQHRKKNNPHTSNGKIFRVLDVGLWFSKFPLWIEEENRLGMTMPVSRNSESAKAAVWAV